MKQFIRSFVVLLDCGTQLELTLRDHDWNCQLNGDATVWACGKTVEEALSSWLLSHKDKLPMTPTDQEILVAWLEGPFRKACVEDVMRLRESLLMLRIGSEHGDSAENCMSTAIASFVQGLILGTTPITVPNDSN